MFWSIRQARKQVVVIIIEGTCSDGGGRRCEPITKNKAGERGISIESGAMVRSVSCHYLRIVACWCSWPVDAFFGICKYWCKA